MELPNLGELELELLSFVSDHAPITVREVLKQFGEPRGLARTTILTVMDRLRKKDYLKRKDRRGVFEYSPCLQKPDLLRKLTKSFTEKVLGGSLDPLVAYLIEDAKLSAKQLQELSQLVSALESKPRGKRHD
jgi:predicted transcriptional regulator